ncbi:MAG: hypothetical protein LBK42_09370, partial [Propionibacteriaceae bacterium]|nr:hypothetical protein [Propionibacteriaceae bacterium]
AWAAAAVHELRGDARVARVAEAARHAHTGLDLAQVLGAAAVGEDEAKRFLADWTDWTMAEIERLGVDGRRGRGPSQADRQLADAAALQGRASLAAYASRRGGRHPVLYVRLLEEELAADEPDTAVGTAVTALAEVPGEFAAERTAIADLMVRAVERAGRPELMEAAVLAGFEAALDLPHYLRLRQVAGHEGRRRALAALDAAPDQTGDAPAVLFLAGEFERLWDLVKDDAAAIGWSHSAKGMAFPLLLALLFGDNPLGSLTGHLVRRCWRGDDDAVSDGLLAAVGAMDRRLPSQCAEPLWLWCQEQVEHRAEAIVTAKHRGAYGRAADLVVAFGEAVASGQGRSRGGREFVSTIRKRYPRHRAFHAELDSSLARSSVELG